MWCVSSGVCQVVCQVRPVSRGVCCVPSVVCTPITCQSSVPFQDGCLESVSQPGLMLKVVLVVGVMVVMMMVVEVVMVVLVVGVMVVMMMVVSGDDGCGVCSVVCDVWHVQCGV